MLCKIRFSWSERADRIQLFRERLSGKVHSTIPKGIAGGFEFSVLQRILKELSPKAMEVRFRVLKESNKSRFDSYSRQEQCWSYPILYLSGLSRAHFFPTTFLEIAVYGKAILTLTPPINIGSFSIDDGDGDGDGDGSENTTLKLNSLFLETLSSLFQFAENVKYKRIFLELIWRPHSSLERERDRKIRHGLFTHVKLGIFTS